jgi:serine/threonine protein kinase
LQGLSHSHIVKYIDSELTETELFIVLEFVEKGSLQDQMKAFGVGGRFPEHLVVRYMGQVLP